MDSENLAWREHKLYYPPLTNAYYTHTVWEKYVYSYYFQRSYFGKTVNYKNKKKIIHGEYRDNLKTQETTINWTSQVTLHQRIHVAIQIPERIFSVWYFLVV